jgi:hypothetical protein
MCHTIPLLAGLCGFRCVEVRGLIKSIAPTFDDYIDWGKRHVSMCKSWTWGCDQALLRDFLGQTELHKYTLDCPQQTAPLHIIGYNPHTLQQENYQDIHMPECNMDALVYSQSVSPGFAGLAVVVYGDQVKELITIANTSLGDAVRSYL